MNGINTYYRFEINDKENTFSIVESKNRSEAKLQTHGAALKALQQIQNILEKKNGV